MTRSSLIIAALALIAVDSADAKTLQYPGRLPCDTTLQACLQSVAAGDIVEIATNDPIDERISISSGITLRAAKGYSPVLGRAGVAGQDFQPCEFDLDGATPQQATIEGLTFKNVRILCTIGRSPNHSVTYRNNTVINTVGNTATRGLSFDFRTAATGVMEGNRITTPGYIIEARLSGAGTQTVRIERNRLTSDTPLLGASGIDVRISSAEPAAARNVSIVSNLLTTAAGCNCGSTAGIAFNVDGEIPVQARIVSNTLDSIGSAGIRMFAIRDAAVDIVLLNNTVSRAAAQGYSANAFEDATLNISAAGNNSFQNGSTDLLPGVTLTAIEPKFVDLDSNNYRLSLDSGLIDSGAVDTGVSVSDTDIDGNPRISGAAIDVGAYEFIAPLVVLFDQRQKFLEATSAALASTPYPVTSGPPEPFVSGNIAFDAAGPSSLNFADWAGANFPQDNDIELAINGNEDLDILTTADGFYALGVDFEDLGGGSTPSTFVVTGLSSGIDVFRFQFTTPDSNRDFIGVWTSILFDTLSIRETSAANENEFFGSVFSSMTPLPVLVFKNGFEEP